MNRQELHLPLDQASAGMTLARDLLDARGQVLMAQGTELGDAALATLHRRDVTAVWVFDTEQANPDLQAQEAALRQHHQERLARLFRHVGDAADDRHLQDLMVRYRGLAAP